MNIYLIRHGKAEATSNYKPHDERELTIDGIRILTDSVQIWRNYVANFDMILSSPLKRAMQTAEIIRDSFDIKPDIVQDFSLLNGGKTEDILNLASSFKLDDIAMIGHQPDIGMHINNMIGTSEINSRIQPATVAKITFNGNPAIGKGKLKFLIPPVIKKG